MGRATVIRAIRAHWEAMEGAGRRGFWWWRWVKHFLSSVDDDDGGRVGADGGSGFGRRGLRVWESE